MTLVRQRDPRASYERTDARRPCESSLIVRPIGNYPRAASLRSMPPGPEDTEPRRAFTLPPLLDMGSVKLEDLEFDLEGDVARLRAAKDDPAMSPPAIQ